MKRLLAGMIALLATSPAFAVNKIYTPYVHEGEWEAEYFGHRSVDDDGTRNNAQAHEFSIGYGVNDWWKTELYGIWEKEPDENPSFDAVEWENIFQFTKPGEYWVDVGGALAYEWTPRSNRADALEVRLLLAKPVGKALNLLNLYVEKEVGRGPTDDFEAGLLWSSRYALSPYFQPGFEIQSEFGEVDDMGSFDDREHYIGPVVYGAIPFDLEDGEAEGLGYRIGYLFGASDAASDGQVVLQLEYELEF